jgi:hypothetical protein
MNSSFMLINDLRKFLEPLKVPWFVAGGWAIDIYLNQVTRERCDLDISVSYSDRLNAINFFLGKDWQIEGKLFGGFKTLYSPSDYNENIHYFWSFPRGAAFISEFVDEGGNRRIAYNRKTQRELDYIEVFFDRIEDGQFIYRREPQLKRYINEAILERDGIKYLAPELVLLFKSNSLTEKNLQDFAIAICSLDVEAKSWLAASLLLLYGNSHIWLKQLS